MSGAQSFPAAVSKSEPMRAGSVWKRIVAIVIVLAAAAVGGVAWMNGAGQTGDESSAGAAPVRPAVNVIVAHPRQAQFDRAVSVQGNVEAKRVAMVSPRLDGVLDEILVDEGDEVVAGETRLFQTDSLRLAKTVEVRRHDVDIAENSLKEKRASLEKYEADYDKAEFDWNKQRELIEKNNTSEDEWQAAKAAYIGAAAMLKHAQALIDLAGAQLSQARSSLAIAEKDLADSLVVAPINGRVVQRYQEPGEMGKPGDAVLRIEDRSLVEISVFLPARDYGDVTPGKTKMHVLVSQHDIGEHEVSYKSPTIDAQLRTFEVRCLLHDPPPAVAPGAMANVRVVLERHTGLGVPSDAIQNRAGQPVLFVAEGGQARMIPVETGLATDGLVEVRADELHENDQVIVVGSYFIDPGDAVKVIEERD